MKSYKSYFSFLDSKKRIFLDSSAATLIPNDVIEYVKQYSHMPLSVFRAEYGVQMEHLINDARDSIMKYFNFQQHKMFFALNASDAVNKVVLALEYTFNEGDQILLNIEDHHSTTMPWIEMAKRRKCEILWLQPNEGILTWKDITTKINAKTKLISLAVIPNTYGVLREDIINNLHLLHSKVIVSLDISQCCFSQIDFSKLRCDIAYFSGHKYFGFTGVGIGVLSEKVISMLKPMFSGGGAVEYANKENITYRGFPYFMEVGTPNILSILSMIPAIEFINTCDVNYLNTLQTYFLSKVKKYTLLYPHLIYCKPIFSFILNVPSHDVSSFLYQRGIYVRAGQQCASTMFEGKDYDQLLRVSLSIYNDIEDIDLFFSALDEVLNMLWTIGL